MCPFILIMRYPKFEQKSEAVIDRGKYLTLNKGILITCRIYLLSGIVKSVYSSYIYLFHRAMFNQVTARMDI